MSHYGDGCFKEYLYQDIMCAVDNAKNNATNMEIITALLQIIADDVIPMFHQIHIIFKTHNLLLLH